jgi:hypothetical protein
MTITDNVPYRISIKSYMNTVIGRFNDTKCLMSSAQRKLSEIFILLLKSCMNELEKEIWEQIYMVHQEVL